MSQEINESVDAFLSRKAEKELKDKMELLTKNLAQTFVGVCKTQLQEAAQGYSTLVDIQNSNSNLQLKMVQSILQIQ